jgi:site-specific DNA-methyltransferase (adenine-specific)
MAVKIEDAGFEIRDMIAWVYGSGFPKSLDVSKAIDKAAGAEREVIGKSHNGPTARSAKTPGVVGMLAEERYTENLITAPATDAAKKWDGWGTALKPALEPITVARKPLIGTVAENVIKHGTGGLNIDGCRVGNEARPVMVRTETVVSATSMSGQSTGATSNGELTTAGRWPANFIHDGDQLVLELFPDNVKGLTSAKAHGKVYFGHDKPKQPGTVTGIKDSGSAARFFYCAKASKKDRDEGNRHPTVKPTDLMRYLCRLVTPPGGTVLDPFMGSGSTGKAAVREGFNFIGIEREAEYLEIARARIAVAQPSTSTASIDFRS